MNTITLRLNDDELSNLDEVVRIASSYIKVSRHKVMKEALLRGLGTLVKEMSEVVIGGDTKPVLPSA